MLIWTIDAWYNWQQLLSSNVLQYCIIQPVDTQKYKLNMLTKYAEASLFAYLSSQQPSNRKGHHTELRF